MLWTPADLAIVRDQVRREMAGMGTQFGIVNSVMPDRLRATVTMADATASSLVKVAGTCWCRPGDKVGLTRYGSEWYVTHILSRVAGPVFGATGVVSPGGNTASTVPVDMPGTPTFAFTKQWSGTPMMIGMWSSLFQSLAAATISLHLAFVGSSSTTTYQVYAHGEAGNGARELLGGVRRIPDATYTSTLPAGEYTARLRWATGAGQINQNTADWMSAYAIEGGS